jgi:hypothetical protein
MPSVGGRCNLHLRAGGGPSIVAIIHDSINAQMGTAYATDDTNTIVWLRNYALAKCLAAAWALNARLANQGDPLKLTTLLERVEKIYALPLDPSLTLIQRRQRILEIEQRRGEVPDRQFITDNLVSKLGGVFVGVEYISPANAVVHSPDGSYPWGTVAAGSPWYSTVMHVLVKTQKPYGYTEGQYREAVASANVFLDSVLPAWCTWTCYHAPEGRTAINTPGGPSAGGIYCDTPNTLDYCVFP